MRNGVILLFDIRKFVEDGFQETQEKSKAFEDEHASTSKRIEAFREQMSNKKWRLLNERESPEEEVRKTDEKNRFKN
ncbi:hypothetical protein [Brevibacillus sp. HD3.3A]|uniref:hypothetical protein n=1 Tax=Brevibacillus sp. HD3.3A TaxID=2738979 RepID=UPI001E36CBB1|nr:hypothetical protein [Brevibacillus sp. HD3.3A]UED72136.1 hypothetical protein HP435_28945 [Brevibacillus sp. HD3.3A]